MRRRDLQRIIGPMFLELYADVPERRRSVSLDRDLFTIGRAPSCDLAFPENPMVSRQHAIIRRDDDAWFLADLGSSNGTSLNGQQVSSPVKLKVGDRIQVGGTSLVCCDEHGAPACTIPQVEGPAPLPASGTPVMQFRGRKMSVTLSDATPFAFGRASTLFRASEPEHGRLCVKLFPQVKGTEWAGVTAFEREVLAQSTLHHPNILPVLDYGLQSHPHGSPFLILPYCEGGSFRNLVRARSFYPFPAVRELLSQAAAGLDAAHASGFSHGDIKPENILLSKDRSHAYLCDFGICNVFAIQERFSTAVGEPGGTTAYLSPEQISQGQQTALSDIYAFAMVVYEVLTGHLPFDPDLPPFRQMVAKVEGRLLDPRRFSPLVNEHMKSVLFLGLNRDPLERPRSATEFIQLLASAASEAKAPDSVATTKGGRVFVSYSHHDAEWLARIRVHLRPLERRQLIEFWDDTRIRPGSEWRAEIETALESAACAIVLVSPHFLASDFCTTEELPRLLRGARERGVTVIPVIISPCRLDEMSPIFAFQAINPPSRTLSEMAGPECDRILVRLAEAVEHSVNREEAN